MADACPGCSAPARKKKHTCGKVKEKPGPKSAFTAGSCRACAGHHRAHTCSRKGQQNRRRPVDFEPQFERLEENAPLPSERARRPPACQTAGCELTRFHLGNCTTDNLGPKRRRAPMQPFTVQPGDFEVALSPIPKAGPGLFLRGVGRVQRGQRLLEMEGARRHKSDRSVTFADGSERKPEWSEINLEGSSRVWSASGEMRSRPKWTYLDTHEGPPNVKFAKLGTSRM